MLRITLLTYVKFIKPYDQHYGSTSYLIRHTSHRRTIATMIQQLRMFFANDNKCVYEHVKKTCGEVIMPITSGKAQG